MNFPTHLLIDVELAKSRLREAFEPAAETDSTDLRERRINLSSLSSRCIRQGAAPSSFIVPEVGGCAAFCS
jgi:hypothetical protein